MSWKTIFSKALNASEHIHTSTVTEGKGTRAQAKVTKKYEKKKNKKNKKEKTNKQRYHATFTIPMMIVEFLNIPRKKKEANGNSFFTLIL